MRTLVTLMCLSMAVLFWIPSQVTAATTDFYGRSLAPYQWKIVGSNPCLGTDLCNDAWAIDQAERNGVFPAAVAEQFRHKLARGDAPTYSQVCPGDQFFISFVKNDLARFTPYAIADFSDGQCRTTKEWYTTDPATGWTYRYFTVLECRNKGGGIVTYLSEPVTSDPVAEDTSNGRLLSHAGGFHYSGGGGYIGGGGGGSTSSITEIIHTDDDIKDPHDPGIKDPHDVLPIPLPATFWLMITALSWMYLIRRRRTYV